MNYDRRRLFVKRCRRVCGKRGCKDCGKVLPKGLFLRGDPALNDILRAGRSVRDLKEAMRERGWYCKGCINRQSRVGTAAASIRDQFATQDEYFEFLSWRSYGAKKFEEMYGKPYTGRTLGVSPKP